MYTISGWKERFKPLLLFGRIHILITHQFSITWWAGKTGRKPTLNLNLPIYKCRFYLGSNVE